MKLIIVRHGQTQLNAANRIQGRIATPLNNEGIWQANQTAIVLAHERIDVAYASSLARAKQTVSIILKYHPDVPVFYTKNIWEKHFGVCEGLSVAEYKNIRAQAGIPLAEFRPDGGENYVHDVGPRVQSFLDQITTRHSDKTILVVTHGGIVRSIVKLLCALSWDEALAIPVKNASITILEKRRTWDMRVVNKKDHLVR